MEDAPAGTSPARGPKTRGRGFVEFTEHEHALCALRQLNNNPQPFGEAVQSVVSVYVCNLTGFELNHGCTACKTCQHKMSLLPIFVALQVHSTGPSSSLP